MIVELEKGSDTGLGSSFAAGSVSSLSYSLSFTAELLLFSFLLTLLFHPDFSD